MDSAAFYYSIALLLCPRHMYDRYSSTEKWGGGGVADQSPLARNYGGLRYGLQQLPKDGRESQAATRLPQDTSIGNFLEALIL